MNHWERQFDSWEREYVSDLMDQRLNPKIPVAFSKIRAKMLGEDITQIIPVCYADEETQIISIMRGLYK